MTDVSSSAPESQFEKQNQSFAQTEPLDHKADIELQDASLDIWQSKYQLKDGSGKPIDQDVKATFQRVAKALAKLEKPGKRKHWQQQFEWALNHGAIPGGRILANIGAEVYKPATSTINCTVSGVIGDSMQSILEKNLEAGLTLKAGCGIGYEFSTLRPKGAYVNGAGAQTSGPLSFMDIFDKMCFTISSAGGRRGAQMATFDVHHPDIEEFIQAKREDGRLRQFNFSLLITQDFIQAVKDDQPWHLSFPARIDELKDIRKELEKDNGSEDKPKLTSRKIHPQQLSAMGDGFEIDANGDTICKVYKTIPARSLWNQIMSSTYDFSEPGFILIDKVNQENNNWFCENIRATNPCGEQPLPPYGSCLLGSINLTQFVDAPFTDSATFNWDQFRQVVAIFTRMLDNVVELNGLALPEQQDEINTKRRHGMGYLGLGSTLTLLKIKYGDAASIAFTEQVSRELAITGWQTGVELAKEKGPAPIFNQEFTVDEAMLQLKPELADDGINIGDHITGKVLLARYSDYMKRIREEQPKLVEDIVKYGCRFTHHTSIAPTGTISLSLGNNASNGIEPSFAHQYSRNIIRANKKTKEKVDVLSYEWLLYKSLNPEANLEELPDYFIASDNISPRQHVDVQAAAQQWMDSSISKTINVPSDIPFDDFKDIYLYAEEKGLKGCTTFRFNPDVFQGVLVREDDLENTLYEFTLESGKKITVKGNEEINYDGETHTAANLFDALKEGYYGKH